MIEEGLNSVDTIFCDKDDIPRMALRLFEANDLLSLPNEKVTLDFASSFFGGNLNCDDELWIITLPSRS